VDFTMTLKRPQLRHSIRYYFRLEYPGTTTFDKDKFDLINP